MSANPGFSRIVAVKTLFDGWNRFHRVTAALVAGQGGAETLVTHSVEDHGDGVGILPFDAERRIVLLVRQARLPLAYAGRDAMSLESPAGGCGGDAPEAAALRELGEETGVTRCDLIAVGAGHPMPGVSTELTHLYLASFTAGDRSAPGGGLAEEGEHIEVVEFPIGGLLPAIRTGTITCLRTIALAYALKDARPDLFA